MNDQAQIEAALATWRQAFCHKDIAALMALYAPDAVCFDAIPPFSGSVAGLQAKMEGCLPYFPDSFAIEAQEQRLQVGADMAFAHCLWRFIELPPGHPAGRHWFRSSCVFQKQADGRWLIVHDHCSAPFDPFTEKVVLDRHSSVGACEMANPVGWFEIYVDDMARAKAFYAAVFGYEFTRLESPLELWAFPKQIGGAGISGALVSMPGLDAGGNSVIVYFSCADCAIESARAAEHGGEIIKAKFSIGAYGYIALLRDSEGNMIGLHSLA